MELVNVYPEETLQLLRERSRALVMKYFKDEERHLPFVMTDSQCDIFNMVYYKMHPRCQALTSTQFGKSTVISFALILRSILKREDFIILAGTRDKADIIMSKVIVHLFDHEYITAQLNFEGDSVENIKRKRSREHITWRDGGSVKIMTANTKNKKSVKEALTGFGGTNIVEDEASLIPDEVQGMVMRMLGNVEGTFLLKIGNAVERNHFHRTQSSDGYLTIKVDYKVALKEGRYSEEYIEEMKKEYNEQDFNLWYGCIFPAKDAVDNRGYSFTFDTSKINIVSVRKRHKGFLKMGIDVGRGGDESVIYIRSRTFAEKVWSGKEKDLMKFARLVKQYIDKYEKSNGLKHYNVFIDDTGVGGGITDRLHELGYEVTPINNAQRAIDSDKYSNIRAENYKELEKWFRIDDGELLNDTQTLNDLDIIKDKLNPQKKIIIIPKDELPYSPNDSDALALTMNVTEEDDELDMMLI